MLETAVLLLALALIGCAIWIARLSAERSRIAGERDLAQQRAADVERNAAQQKDSFRALAGETLKAESEQFLRLATQTLAARESSAVAEMDKRKAALDQLLKPIGEALARTHEELKRIEGDRTATYASLRAQVQGIADANVELRKETGRLVQALVKPHVRGRYGEMQLQRVAELSGMKSYCDFALQDAVRDAEGNLLKPDMVVKMASGRELAVDAKTNIDAYIAAMGAATPELAERELQRYAQHVVEQAQALGKKSYWKQYDGSPEFTVMFLPGDQFLDAALERRPDLIEIAAKANVVLASPSTLIGLLRAVHVGWREKRLAENAAVLFELGKQLQGRLGVALGHADKVGQSLRRAVEDYNKFVGSVESRVMPTLRKFEESGASAGEPVEELSPVESLPRATPLLEVPASDAARDER